MILSNRNAPPITDMPSTYDERLRKAERLKLIGPRQIDLHGVSNSIHVFLLDFNRAFISMHLQAPACKYVA